MTKNILFMAIGVLSSFCATASDKKSEIFNSIQSTSKVSKAVLESAQSINDVNEELLSLEVQLFSRSKNEAKAVINSLTAPVVDQRISRDGGSFYIVTTLRGLLEIYKNNRTIFIKSGTGIGLSSNTSSTLISTMGLPASDYKGKGVKIAVIDSGINNSHPQIQGRIIKEYCFQRYNPKDLSLKQIEALEKTYGKDYGICPNNLKFQTGKNSAADNQGHGTHVTGIIAANKSKEPNAAPEGGASKTEIVSIKVINSYNEYELADLLDSLKLLEEDPSLQDVKIINLSLGSKLFFPGTCDSYVVGEMKDRINQLASQGKIIIVANGNEGLTGSEEIPSCLSNVISVAAHGYHSNKVNQMIDNKCLQRSFSEDEIMCYSNVSEATDIAAPGQEIISLDHESNGTKSMNGTSQAAPAVTACVARMLEKNPTLSLTDIKTYLQYGDKYIKKSTDSDYYIPRLNCGTSLDLVPAMSKKQ
ncbi:S8 family peptidase [Spartinivicinus ruber]|uniref:S8 family peptidase n=1 Tax=Spartinivicinus ruber TaxID=2683272 RepID=UPI0013D837DB|nr:S8/S53 family peptidase [Spartinivicinus ruber]